MKVNDDKSDTILFKSKYMEYKSEKFRSKRREFKTEKEKEGNDYVPDANVVKYLGVNLESCMRFNKHIEI